MFRFNLFLCLFLVWFSCGNPESKTEFPSPLLRPPGESTQLEFSDTISSLFGGPRQTLSSDLDRDGNIDLVFVDFTKSSLNIWFSKGNGQFQPPLTLPFDPVSGPNGFQIVDMNGDQFPDFVFGTFKKKNLNVWLNNKNQTFTKKTELSLPGTPFTLTQGDFNHDKNIDVVVVVSSEPKGTELFLYPGKGDGTFDTSLPIIIDSTLAFVSGDLQASDINGDGDLDLLAIGQVNNMMPTSTYCILVWQGKGDGTFSTMQMYDTEGSKYPTWVDINQDGLLDAISDVVLLGKSDGTFQKDINWGVPTAERLVFGDINRDGKLDLVTIQWNPELTNDNHVPIYVLVLYDGDEKGNFTFVQQLPVPGHWGFPASIDNIVVSDLNQDGWLDIVYPNEINGTISLYFGDQDGTLQTPQEFSSGLSTPMQILVDKNQTIILDTTQQAILSIHVDVGGIFFNGTRLSFILSQGWEPSAMALGDIDGDGYKDVVAISQNNNQMRILKNIPFLAGNERWLSELPTLWDTGPSPSAVVITDWNQDNQQDIVIAQPKTNSILFFQGNGNFTFQPPVEIPIGLSPSHLIMADLDQDHMMDALTLSSTESNTDKKLGISWGFPGGKVATNTTIPLEGTPLGFTVGDINQDGLNDIVVTTTRGVWIFKNQGNRTFTSAKASWNIANPHTPQLVDLNQDGYLDLVITDTSKNQVVILHGTGQGEFIKTQLIPVGLGPTSLSVASFDENSIYHHPDTLPDLLVINSLSRTISSLRNVGSL